MSGRVIKKNATQKFQYEKGMEVLSGKQFIKHMAHLRTEADFAGKAEPGTMVSGNKA